MIELSTILGAMIFTLGGFQTDDVDGATFFIVLIVMPILGALWGVAVGALIHFTFNGYLPGLLMSFFS